MAQPFLGLYCIIRNAEKTIKTLLDSIEGVFDEVVFVDTGSTDSTKQIVEEHFHLQNRTPKWDGERLEAPTTSVVLASFEWIDDFSAARNYSYSLGTAKWRCYLDADDDASDFKKKLRPMLERTDKEHPDVNCISIGYRYTTDGGMVQDKLGRIVRWDGGWAWNDPIHEHLERLPGRGARNISKYLDMEVKHQHATQERINAGFERNVRITEKWYNTATDPKKKALAAYYLAIAAHGVDKYDLARRFFREAVDGLGRINLSAESLSRWARMELKLGNIEQAVALASESFGNDPDLPDGLSVLGATLTAAGETSRAVAVFDMLRAKPKPILESHHDVIWLDGLVNVYAAKAYYREGRVDDAVRALNSIPKDMINHPEVHAAGHEIHNSLQKTEGFKRLQQLWEFLIWDTEPLKAKRLLEEFAPAAISDSPAVKQLLAQTEKKMPHMKDWGAYQRTYAGIPELPYHVPDTHREWTLQQGRARMVRQWAEGLPKEGPVVEVLVIGVQDGLIEGGMMEANPRIHLTACDVAPQASKGINELIERFPGRVRTHQVKEDHYDWFPSRRADYDAIILFEVLEHLPDDEKAVKIIRQYLKSDGRFFLSTPIAAQWVEEYLSDMKSPRPWWHVRAHNPSSLWNLLQKVGFTGSLIGLGQESLFLGSLTPTTQPTEEVSIYVYPLGAHGFDPFSPKDSHTGGSEEAVIHLSAAFARQGVKVTVYTDMPKRKDTTFVFNGVQWKGHPEFDVGSLKGTLLVWRAPALAANFKRANPRLKVLNWLHDTHYQASPAAYEAVDGTVVLSRFHATTVDREDGFKGPFLYAANGIVPSEFPEPDESKRDPHAAIYASAPNRGLEFLLDVWPQIRAQVPDATLRVYYSWVLTEQMMEKRSDLKAVMGPLLEKLKKQFEALKDQGVTYLGGVDHKTLHEAYRTSGVWTYPVGASGFEEISCISAMKAQAAGCWPVVVPLGALEETCRRGTFCGAAGFVDSVTRAMLDPPNKERRAEMRANAIAEFSWDKAASQFLAHSRAKSQRVTIYAGRFIRQFDGTGSADGKPLGGSEEAVIAMAHALAERGEEVVVYCPLPDGKARDDGSKVRWLDVSTFVPAGPHGTLLAWRCPMLVPMLKGNGYPVVLWLMDPEYGAYPWDYEEADDVVFLTESHKDIIRRKDGYNGGGSAVPIALPKMPELGTVKRDPKDVMWATSPDRGLLEFLRDVWPRVIKEVPDAFLHVFYGLEPLERHGKKELADAIRAEMGKLQSVGYHGGVSDEELYGWYQRCGIFAYRSLGFEETQSLSLCKAQALGCWPVVNDAGCLKEIVLTSGGSVAMDGQYANVLIAELKYPHAGVSIHSMVSKARERFSVPAMVDGMLKVIERLR